ncbi:MAG: DUF2207 domain-containing protein [Marmoricola sp.]|nr:DUF2207 domain-containing protein [Marmoricola sp.]
MKRWLVWLVGLVVLGVLVLIPALTYGSGSGAADTDVARIDDYSAQFTVHRDGVLNATETLKVSYPVPKHGIFRFFDVADPNDDRVRLVPRDVSVTRDGHSEPFQVLREGHGRYRNVKIGSAGVTMDGQHTYVIRYTIDGVLLPRGDSSLFYWNLIPSGWQLPITRSSLVVRLPATAQAVRCAVGVNATTGCVVRGVGTQTLVTGTGALPPHTPVTVQAAMNLPVAARDHKAWPVRYDAVLGPNTAALGIVAVMALLAGALGLLVARRTREREPQYPLMYAPPDGIGPAEARYVYSERVPREAFVASIMQTAEKGATTLTHTDGWTITDTGHQEAWQQLDPVSAYAVQSLGVPGGSFTADKTVSSGRTLQSALEHFEAATKSWARQNGLLAPAGLGVLGSVLVVGSFALAVFLALKNPFDMSLVDMIPGLFAVLAVETLRPGSSTRRTPAGRELWSRIGGFRRILATDSAEARFDFSGRRELYTAYIPWAVAFGVADRWAAKYHLETGEAPPQPSYFGPYAAGYTTGSLASSMVDDFSSTVDSAISAYQATQSSSSSGGGGGFSGGGGGGGGGGGSW